jgi:hypothetical protein
MKAMGDTRVSAGIPDNCLEAINLTPKQENENEREFNKE